MDKNSAIHEEIEESAVENIVTGVGMLCNFLYYIKCLSGFVSELRLVTYIHKNSFMFFLPLWYC